MITRTLSCAVLSVSFILSAVPVSFADSIRVCSRYKANTCVVGKTRTTSKGDMVRMPGGTWLDCRGDCYDRLRFATVDFWKNVKLTQ
jgi:hypothetical protein